MKTEVQNIIEFIENRKNIIFPVYQRKYVWEEKQWKILWENIQTTVKQKRGIRGKVQASNAQDNVDYVEEALKVMIAYTYMSKGQLLDFFGKAELTEADGILIATAKDVFAKGDMLTVKVEKETNLFVHKKFSGMMGEDPISGEMNYAKFSSGINHVSDHVLNLPAKNAIINSTNKDYSQRVQ